MPEPSAALWAGVERFPILGFALDVRSLYNVGAIFRASDAARVQHLYLTGMSGHPGNQRDRIDKTALGAIDAVPWTYVHDPLPLLHGLKAHGVTIAALEVTPESQPLAVIAPAQYPIALVVGHETDGVPPAVLELADLTVALPTYGRKPSLNVALAYGIAVLELAQSWAASRGVVG